MKEERYKKIFNMLRQRQPGLTVLMENVHKAHNLAAITRTCDAVGVPEIHAVTRFEEIQITQDAASGSGKWVEMIVHSDIEESYKHLKSKGFTLLTAHFDARAKDYRKIDFTKPTAIIVGQELDGLTQEAVDMADGSIIIPMCGMVQSLNVSVATAVILYEAQRQRELAGMYKKNQLDKSVIDAYIFEKGYPRLAKKYQMQGKPYPELDETGTIIKEH